MTAWSNYFVKSTKAYGHEGHITAESLRDTIKAHDGGEAYHCAFDLEPRENFNNYVGLMRPSLGYAWFDFDSHEDKEANIQAGVQALADTRAFISFLGVHDVFICYSGSKGFHVGVPFECFGLEPSNDLGVILNRLATHLKSTYKTLDTTIYNANRKFRALGSKHPKTGLFKVVLTQEQLASSLDDIKTLATSRGSLEVPPVALRSPLDKLTALLKTLAETPKASPTKSVQEKTWLAPSGNAAFEKCGFLKRCKEQPATINEPQWYAALSIVSRFQEGRKQCHGISIGHPGYSVGSCNEKIDQAEKESAPRTCANVATLSDECKSCPLYGKINSPVNIFDTRFYIVGDKGKLLPDYNSLLAAYMKHSPYKTITDMKTVYQFKETHYVETNHLEIKAFAEESFEPKPQDKLRQEFVHKVLANNTARREFFTKGIENKINFRNGVFETTSETVSPHSPDYGFRNVLPYDYNPTAQAPVFLWWINDVMLGDKELVAILQEFMGYIVRGGDYKYHKALWLAGTGRNGKSTFLDVLKSLIGADNYSALSIKAISQDKFSSADLDGKIANFSEETSPEELSDSSQFKNLTGDGDVNAQKKYGDPYKFRNRAKLIMTYNEVPELRDLSPGMMSRPLIVPWEKDLSADELQDKSLKQKLLAELPGIFNFAFEGWKRLEAQGQFTYSAKSELAKANVRESSCSAQQWIQNYVTFLSIDANSANREVRTPGELYEAYKATEGRFAYKAVKFFRRINEHAQIKKRRRATRNSAEYFSMMIRQSASFDAAKSDPTQGHAQTRDVPRVEY